MSALISRMRYVLSGVAGVQNDALEANVMYYR